MTRPWLALPVVLALLPVAGRAGDPTPGPVVAMGGGRLTDAIVDRVVALAGGKRLVVCPAASEKAEGPEVERFRERGAKDVVLADFRARAEADDPERARALEGIGGVFFTGGDQKRLLETLRGTRALAALRADWEKGAVVAGTSAGCAVLGEATITGDGDDAGTIKKGATPVTAGFAFVKGAIVDQHFLARRRHNRLVSALLDDVGRVGIGVDERTAAVVRGTSLEVVGDGVVSVYLRSKEARTFTLRLLEPGEKLELGR